MRWLAAGGTTPPAGAATPGTPQQSQWGGSGGCSPPHPRQAVDVSVGWNRRLFSAAAPVKLGLGRPWRQDMVRVLGPLVDADVECRDQQDAGRDQCRHAAPTPAALPVEEWYEQRDAGVDPTRPAIFRPE